MNLLHSPAEVFVSKKDIPFEEEIQVPHIWDKVPHKSIQLPFKCFIDIVEDYASFAKERADYISSALKGLLYDKYKRQKRGTSYSYL